MPIMPQYRSPYGQSIAELLMRQGEIAARGAERSGQIWGNAVQNLGQIGAQAYEQHAEQQQAGKRDAALSAFVDSGVWRTDPEAALAGSIKILGPRGGLQFAEGLNAAAKMMGGDPTEAAKSLPIMARSFLAAPDSFKPTLYGNLTGLLERSGLVQPGQLPGEWSPDLLPMFQAYAGGDTAQKTRQVEVQNADGSKSIQIVEDKPGQTFASAAPPVKAENLSAEEAYVRAQYGDKPTAQQLLEGRARFAAAGRAPAAPAAGTDPGTVSAYVDDLAAGTKIWSDVPASIRNSVQVAARAAGVNAPTKRPTEKVLGELSDGANLVTRTAELLNSPTGVMEWAKANGIPDWVTQLTSWGASAKANRSEFFMYMAETLKAIQGSRPSDKDMEWYMANLPRQGEAPQSAQLKIDKIKARLVNQYNTRLTSLRRNGYALPGLELLSGEGQYLAPDENPTGGAPRGAGTSGNPYVFE